MRSLILLPVIFDFVLAWNLVITPHGERLQNRRTGDNFLVVCKVKDYDGAASDVKVEWYRNGQLVSRIGSIMTIYKTYSNQLMVNRPKTTDGGEYICKAEVNGEEQEIKAEISFVEPPKFIDPEHEQHPEEGRRAEIKCKVEGSEDLDVFWQFNGATLDESTPRGYEFSEDKQTLIIPSYNSKKDDGTYNCNAAQHSSFETLTINVTGYSRPSITVFDAPPNKQGFEGQSAELKCGATGKPMPEYQWYNQDNEEILNSDKYRVEGGLLVIESLGSEDAGSYKCVATNPIGNDTRVANITVFLKPKIEKLVDFTKTEGDEVEIICRYSGEGDLSAKFTYGSQEFKVLEEVDASTEPSSTEDLAETRALDNEDSEEAENVRASTVGSNSAEKLTTDTTLAESTTDNEEEEEATTDEDEEDEEKEEDEEEEEQKRWKRFVSDVNSERISVRAEDNALILTIRDLTLEDAGAYKCLVSNEAGVSNKTSNLAITHPPVFRSSSDELVRSFDGNTVTIFCDVSAVPPPEWTWTNDGNEVEADGANIILDSNGEMSRLTIKNQAGKNYGKYECKATNAVGKVSKTIEILEVLTPTNPIGLDCKKLLYPNYGKCSFDESSYTVEKNKPTEVIFLIANLEEMGGDYDWEQARAVKVEYDEKDMTIPNLRPNSQYMVRAKAINEAGESEITDQVSMETTDPWVPKKPESVKMECEESCTVSWEEANDHGSDITKYRIVVQEMSVNEETSVKEPVGNAFVVEVEASETSIELSHIRPNSHYKVSVAAINAIGQGEATEINVETDDSPIAVVDSLSSVKLILAVVLGLFFLIFVVDLICYSANRCGLIACICINCLGRNPSERKDRDVESGRGENNRLLDNAGSSSPLSSRPLICTTNVPQRYYSPLTTTV